jgi:hypothetical protein
MIKYLLSVLFFTGCTHQAVQPLQLRSVFFGKFYAYIENGTYFLPPEIKPYISLTECIDCSICLEDKWFRITPKKLGKFGLIYYNNLSKSSDTLLMYALEVPPPELMKIRAECWYGSDKPFLCLNNIKLEPDTCCGTASYDVISNRTFLVTASGDTIKGTPNGFNKELYEYYGAISEAEYLDEIKFPTTSGPLLARELVEALDTIHPPFKVFYKDIRYRLSNTSGDAIKVLPLDSLIVRRGPKKR